MPNTFVKKVSDSEFTLSVPAYPAYINELGHVKAGHVLKLIDIAAGITAKKHVGKDLLAVTASLDRTDFASPIRAWEIINLKARLTRVWNTSMEVQVTVEVWDFNTDESRHICTSYLVMAALTNNRQKPDPGEVADLLIDTELDKRLAEEADVRKEFRKQEGREVQLYPIDAESEDPIIFERLMTPMDANTMNNVFGGVILASVHKVGRLAAVRQAQSGTTVGVRQDRMSFLAPVFIGETLRARAIITKTWHSSLEVQVEVEAVNPTTWDTRHVAQSYLVYVRIGPDGRPQEVPPWIPATDLQRSRAEAAEKRRNLWLQEKEKLANTLASTNV